MNPLFHLSLDLPSLQSLFEGFQGIVDVGDFFLVNGGCRTFDLPPVVEDLRDVENLIGFFGSPQEKVIVLTSFKPFPKTLDAVDGLFPVDGKMADVVVGKE